MSGDGEVTKAAILAAGAGTRLRPLTVEIPKVLLPVGGMPLICHTLNWVRRHGIQRVAVNLHHRADRVREFLGDGSRFGVEILFSPEERLMGTAGDLRRMEHFFVGSVVVVYGDVLTNFDLGAMVRFHRRGDALATLALVETSRPWEVGVVQVTEDGRVVDFIEKPRKGTVVTALANGGVYVLEREILDWIPEGVACDFGHEVFPRLIQAGKRLCGYHIPSDAYLIDIGTPGNYLLANRDVAAGRLSWPSQAGM
ncbi:MAG: nucleotidyltransferase family protein [Chloroflexota bacterium]